MRKSFLYQASGLYMHTAPPTHLYPTRTNHPYTYHRHIHRPKEKKKKYVFIDRMNGIQDAGLSQVHLQPQLIERLSLEGDLGPGLGVIVKLLRNK